MRIHNLKTKSQVVLIIAIILTTTITTALLTFYDTNKDNEDKNQESIPDELKQPHNALNNPPNAFFFNYYKIITIDHNQVEGTNTLINFTLLISIFDSDLKEHVQSDGDDIAFTNGTIWLDHEIESFNQNYNSKFARLVAWVRLPSLSCDSDTVIYMYYGNSTMTSRQNPSGVWDPNYGAIWHLHNDFLDSTSNNNDAINSGSTDTNGIIADAQSFDATDDYINAGSDNSIDNIFFSHATISAWIYPEGGGENSYGRILDKSSSTTGGSGWTMCLQSNARVRFYRGYSTDDGQWSTPQDSIIFNQWQHVAVYYNESLSTNDPIIYINGIQQSIVEDDTPVGNAVNDDGQTLYIGNNYDGARTFDGIIDEVRIHYGNLSNDWIKTEYNNQGNPKSFYTVSRGYELNPPIPEDFNYYKEITIDHNQVEGDLTNYPLLLSLLDSDLKEDVQSDGDDIAFWNGTSWLDHDIEIFDQNYNSRLARLVAWVRIPSLSSSVDTKIYMYYGNSEMESRETLTEVWESNYMGIWHLNEQSGGSNSIIDSTSYNNFGTNYNGVTFNIEGQTGKSVSFNDASNQRIEIADDSSLDITDELTIEAWIKPTVVNEWTTIVSKMGGSWGSENSDEEDLYFAIDDGGGLFIGLANPTEADEWNSNVAITAGIWQHVIFTYNSSTSYGSIYLNGDFKETYRFKQEDSSDLGPLETNNNPFYIGFNRGWTEEVFDGTIDEVRVSNTVRSAAWIETEYNNQKYPNTFYSVGKAIKIYASKENYKYYKEITIYSSQVSGSMDLVDFPVFISIFDSDLHNKVQSDGDDIAFSDDTGTNWLAYEIEVFNQNYNTTHAQLIAWVCIPSLSASSDTDIRMYYGNSTLKSQEHPKGVWDTNYMAVWHLKEDPTGTIYDSTTNNYDGSSSGGMSDLDQVDGKIDGSLDFDGTDDRIIIGQIDSNAWTAITLEAWMKMDDTGDDRVISKEEGTGGGPHIWMLGKTSNNLKCRITTDGTGGGFSEIQSSGGLTVGNWYYIVMTWNSSTESFKGYINGEPVANIQRDGDTITNSIVDVILADQAAGVRQFNGIISDAQISKDSRSEDWIRTEYRNQNNPNSFYSIGPEESTFFTVIINAIDVNGNIIPNVNITMYKYTQLLKNGLTNDDGYVSFLDIIDGDYNFTATITSDIGNYVELVNTTTNAISIDADHKIVNLICNVGSNFFEVFDIDGESVDSGYILIGNSSNLLSNCSIDENGKARFWWVKTAPYNYNYTIKYKDALYNPSEITLAEGVLTVPNIPSNPNMINTNLTTVNFTIVGNDDITPVPGAKLILRRSDNWDSIVNLTTNIYGKTTLRWLNSSGFILGAIVNYSLKIDFFGFPLFFNSTGAGYSDDPYNFTVIAKTSYTFKVDVNPTEYSTELISLNPPSLPPIEWGIQLKVRALFNVTDAGGIGDVGPINPDYMFYNILDGTKSVLSGNMVREEGKIGIYQGIIDTTKLQSDKPYLIQISAMKLGYTSPEPLDIVLFITLNHMILNQSENDDSPIEVRWLETAEMTVKPYGEDTEIMIIGDDLFIGENNRVEISIPDLHTTWNLSKIEFNLYNVQHGSIATMYLNITDPDGTVHSWDGSDTSNYDHYGDSATNGTWIDIIIEPTNDFQAPNNDFDFQIEGSFIGTVQLVAEATFIRDKLYAEYFESNITESIILPSDGNGWAIKNITFELINCVNLTGDAVNPANYIDNITTNEGFIEDFFYDVAIGTGKLTINDTIIYPLDGLFIFYIENTSGILFDVIIKIEYIQEFYMNQYLEVNSHSKIENNFSPGNFSISPDDWSEEGVTLYIKDLKNSGSVDIFPSDVAMNITVAGTKYSFQDSSVPGQGLLLLQNISKDILLTAFIQANDIITFNLSYEISYSRTTFNVITGSMTCTIKEAPQVSVSASYNEEYEYYVVSIDTSALQSFDYTVHFESTNANYDVGIKELDLNVLERLTLINGSSPFYTKFYQIIAMEAFNYTFWYLDNYSYQPITDLTEKSYTWEKYGNQGETIESGVGDLFDATDNSYILDFDTEDRDTGDYFIVVNLKKNNYVPTFAFITLTIIDRPTLINGVSQLATIQKDIFITEQINFTFTYVDKYNVNITDLDIQSYNWSKFNDAGNLIDIGGGILIAGANNTYILDFNTEFQSEGRYVLNITLGKDKYEFKTAEIILRINLREIDYNLGDNFKNKQINVVKGNTVTLEIELSDPFDDSPIEGAKVVLEIENKEYEFDEVDDGVYELEFDTEKYDAFITSNTLTGTIKISKKNYGTEEIDITIIIEMEEIEIIPGTVKIPIFYLLLLIIAIVSVAGSLATYRYIQLARIPGFVKKIRSIKDSINKSVPIPDSISITNKEIYMVNMVNESWETLGLSVEGILGVKANKGKILPIIKKKIKPSDKSPDLMPKGLILMKWDERVGTEVIAKYPEDIEISQKTLMQIYGAHEYTGESGMVTLMVGSLNIASYYTGQERGYYLVLLLNVEDDADTYEGGMLDVLQELLYNLSDDSYLQLIPSLFRRLALYPTLNSEQHLIITYQDDIKRLILNRLRDEGVISKSELLVWLKDKYKEGFIDLDAILNDLVKKELIKQVSVKGMTSEQNFFTGDLIILRVPPVKLIKNPGDIGLPSQLAKLYIDEIKKFFETYHPTEEDNVKIIETLVNPQVYLTFQLLRSTIATKNDLEKLKKKGVDDISNVLKLLWDANLIRVFQDKTGTEYYALQSDFYIESVFPKYVLKSIKNSYEQKSQSDKVLIEFLNVLEDTYLNLKSK